MLAVRPATCADAARLRRLAGLDSAVVPAGELLIAEEDGELRAAFAPGSGECIADPFARTAAIVEMLRAYSTPSRARTQSGRRLARQALARSIFGS